MIDAAYFISGFYGRGDTARCKHCRDSVDNCNSNRCMMVLRNYVVDVEDEE
jgi:hypothetical protein